MRFALSASRFAKEVRVALVHDYLIQFGGAERVLRVLADVFPRAPIFTLLNDPGLVHAHFSDRRIYASFLQKLPFAPSYYRLLPPFMPQAIESFDFSNYDVVISSSASFAKGIITRAGTLHISYCHTPLRYVWDDAHRYAEEFRAHPRFLRRLAPLFLHYLRVWDRAAALRPDCFIANSRFVAQRIKKYYGRDAEVIYPPVRIRNQELGIMNQEAGIEERESVIHDSKFKPHDSPYFLMVGRLVPYKRFDLAVEAFNDLGTPLKIIGTGPELSRLRRIAKPNIAFVGYVPDAELSWFYRDARALIFPQEEDFGIVAVEAMAWGKPVIAYRGGGALETIEEGRTGLFFDAQNVSALKAALARFKDEDFDAAAIREHAARFSEDRFKREIQEFITQQLSRK